MRPFTYTKVSQTKEASTALKTKSTALIAGGTNLLDLMKLDVVHPEHVVDINKLSLSNVSDQDGGIMIGALARNSDLAHNKLVIERTPMLSQALLSGASAQVRNMASVGGNLLQKTRCYYYRNSTMPCNKRQPGSGCPAIEGYNRIHAILGGSKSCIASNPSDMAVAMVALDAIIYIESSTEGKGSKRQVPITKFYTLPGAHPEKETVLQEGEIITAVEIPKSSISVSKHSAYLKVRDRSSFAFALVSAACALEKSGGVIKSARLALGGVGTIPWRCVESEKFLQGKAATKENFKAAAELALKGAEVLKHNKFKVELCKRTIVKAFMTLENLA